jgi:hypothetical protein
MTRSEPWLRLLVIGLLLLVAIIALLWLLTGRLRLFDTASRIDFGFENTEEQYRQQVLWLSPGAQLQQDFVSKYPGLSRIDLFLTGLKMVNQEIDLVFHLRDSCDSAADLRTVRLTIGKRAAEDNLYYPIAFPPIDESTGRTYCFLLEPAVSPDQQDRIGVWASQMDLYGQGQATYQTPPEISPPPQPEPEPAGSAPYRLYLPLIVAAPNEPDQTGLDVSFQLHYHGRPLETISVFFSYLAQDKSSVWGSTWFYGILLLLYSGGVYFLLRLKPD